METKSSLTVMQEFRRSWRVVLAAMLGLGFGAGASLYWFGVLIKPLAVAFGWSNSVISGWALALTVALNVCAPVSGLLADRKGARFVALWSIPLVSVTFISVGLFMHTVWILYAGAFIIGAAGSGSACYIRAINSWLDAGRGFALGVAFCGNALTAMFLPRLTQMIVDSMGWRLGFIFLGAMTLVPLPVTYMWLHERRDGVEHRQVAQETGYRMLEVLRLRAFWLIGVAGLLYFLFFVGMQFSLIPFLTDGGLSRANAALYAGAMGAFVLIGKLVTGALYDRFHAPFVIASLLLADVGAIALLALFQNDHAIVGLAVIGFVHGALMPGIPYCITRYFGLRFFGGISGLNSVLFGLSALGPLLFSMLRDSSGSYGSSLFVSGGLAIGAATLFTFLGFHSYLPVAAAQVPEKL
jgi:predicted MFS family arabinose efflux permease